MYGICAAIWETGEWPEEWTWTGLFVEESVRMTEDRDKWRK